MMSFRDDMLAVTAMEMKPAGRLQGRGLAQTLLITLPVEIKAAVAPASINTNVVQQP